MSAAARTSSAVASNLRHWREPAALPIFALLGVVTAGAFYTMGKKLRGSDILLSTEAKIDYHRFPNLS
ncbi:hypothetical protein H696_02597 [Fonticula alba]|uniref:Uncharacterized protein n=1 Tax=Fonticula alba TaxID=691883 RepID=A0A058Z9Q5_FONAL|nr:hypothetical protein H696_02597 [Fonticula alba]KCV70267.1 hypothetical protein H696_02597 [Fonticula alba]|eukprot:XP_009494783.1 hypothetical protein H696_02597 [Fonticula alba]